MSLAPAFIACVSGARPRPGGESSMRVLLTGSSGWLGRYLVPLLAENGHKVIGLDVPPGAYTAVVGAVARRALRARTARPFPPDPHYIPPTPAQEHTACCFSFPP